MSVVHPWWECLGYHSHIGNACHMAEHLTIDNMFSNAIYVIYWSRKLR